MQNWFIVHWSNFKSWLRLPCVNIDYTLWIQLERQIYNAKINDFTCWRYILGYVLWGGELLKYVSPSFTFPNSQSGQVFLQSTSLLPLHSQMLHLSIITSHPVQYIFPSGALQFFGGIQLALFFDVPPALPTVFLVLPGEEPWSLVSTSKCFPGRRDASGIIVNM